MRTSFSTMAIMVTSLLVKEALSAPAVRRDYYLDTDIVLVDEEVFVTALADGSYTTGSPVAVGTTTVDGSAVLVTEPVPSSTVSPAAPTAQVPSTTEASSIPTPSTSSTPIPEPTTTPTVPAVFIESKSDSAEPTTSTPISVVPTTTAAPVVPTTFESVPIPATTSSAAPVPTVAPPVSSSGKRGLAYNAANLLSAFNSSSASWAYNWGSTTPTIPSKFEYVPMLWGLRQSELAYWDQSVATALAAGSTHLLAFNEPDLPAQANLGFAEAAAGYMKYMQPYASKAKLVSPAVTNGGGQMGLTWLTNFLGACSGCTIDKVAIHWYNGGDAAAFKEYMAKAYTAGGNRPLWITEFEASGSAEEQAAFLTEVMAWMDKTDYIERYAYFMVSDGNLVDGTSLSPLGNTYATS